MLSWSLTSQRQRISRLSWISTRETISEMSRGSTRNFVQVVVGRKPTLGVTLIDHKFFLLTKLAYKSKIMFKTTINTYLGVVWHWDRGTSGKSVSDVVITRRILHLRSSSVPLDLSPVHGHNQHRNAAIPRRAATFPASTSGGGMYPVTLAGGMLNITTRIYELLVTHVVGGKEGEGVFWSGEHLEMYTSGFWVFQPGREHRRRYRSPASQVVTLCARSDSKKKIHCCLAVRMPKNYFPVFKVLFY